MDLSCVASLYCLGRNASRGKQHFASPESSGANSGVNADLLESWGLRERAPNSWEAQLRTDAPANRAQSAFLPGHHGTNHYQRRMIETATTACRDITRLSQFRGPGLTENSRVRARSARRNRVRRTGMCRAALRGSQDRVPVARYAVSAAAAFSLCLPESAMLPLSPRRSALRSRAAQRLAETPPVDSRWHARAAWQSACA